MESKRVFFVAHLNSRNCSSKEGIKKHLFSLPSKFRLSNPEKCLYQKRSHWIPNKWKSQIHPNLIHHHQCLSISLIFVHPTSGNHIHQQIYPQNQCLSKQFVAYSFLSETLVFFSKKKRVGFVWQVLNPHPVAHLLVI